MWALRWQKSMQKCIDSHPSSKPIPQHYTTHFGWGESCYLNPTSLTGLHGTSSTNSRGIHLNHSLKGASLSNFNHMFGQMSAAKLAGF